MQGKSSFKKQCGTLVLLVFGLLLGAAWAQTERVLYSFCARNGCLDGEGPLAGVVFDQKGNLCGTTQYGGAYRGNQGYGAGVVFKLTPKGKETVLHSFCSQGGDNCTDGANPLAGVVLDHSGNLYGTTYNGGANNIGNCWYNGPAGCGVVFKVTPKGEETVFYSFCSVGGATCTDGANPSAGVVFDQKGNLYGTTTWGGAYGGGVVFKLTPEGKETVLYSFCAQTNCLDGAVPVAGVVFDGKGNLYGTASLGGAYGQSYCSPDQGNYGCGVVFKLTPDGEETVLHNFCAQNNCSDGVSPEAGVILDQKGNLYGTTAYGGNVNNNGGVAFKLTPKGKEKVLYSFCAQSECADGWTPQAGMVFDDEGNLYGTTAWGGSQGKDCFPQGCGIVFKLTPQGKEQILYKFCTTNNCSDGLSPWAGLTFDGKGNLYGTTELGGTHNGCGTSGFGCGVVFKLTP